MAKNVITVGAVNDAVTSGVRDLSKATMSTVSSWGPINAKAAADLFKAQHETPEVPRLIDGAAAGSPVPLEVSPAVGETGNLEVTIDGTSFAAGAVVAFFRSGFSEVSVVVTDVTTTITGTVDLSAMAMGYWGGSG